MRTVLKRLLALVLTVMLAFLSFTPVQVRAEGSSRVTLLHTNDIHCGIRGYEKVAAYKQSVDNPVALLDMGDHIQGEIIGRITQGQKIVEIMNAAGYDLAIPGNHEFDYQVPAFLNVVDNANYSYLASNFKKIDGSDVVTPGGKTIKGYEIKEMGGHIIGFVGIATPETYTKSTPKYFQDEEGNWVYTFSEDTSENPNRFYPTIQASIDAARAEGAELVVVMAHTGIDGTERAWAADSVIANTTGVDIYLDGHSHEEVAAGSYPNKNGESVYYQQTGSKTKVEGYDTTAIKNLGRVDIDFDAEGGFTVNGSLIDVIALEAEDDNVKTIVDAAIKVVKDSYSQVVGHTDYLLSTLDENGKRAVRSHETNMGDFNADAYRILGNSDIALVNGGGVRADLEPGDITREAISKVNPFGNNVVTVKLTGQQILDALEHSYRNLPNENGGFFQVSGLTVTINQHNETPVVADEKGTFDHVDETKPRRVQEVNIGGEPLDPEKIYTVTGTTYILQQAGDGMTMFGNPEVVKLYDEPDSEFVERYLVEVLGGAVPPEYDGIKGQGRIIILEGHEWDTPTYEWAEDNSTVTAKRVCLLDESHVEEETVKPKVEYLNEEDKTEATFIGEFKNEAFEKQTKTVKQDTVVLLHTNDVHCGIVNYDKVAAYKKGLTDPAVLLDIGDHIQGEIIGRITQGQKIVEIMNSAGYDYAALGNHEFDYQVPALLEVVDNANYTYLASNFKKADGSDVTTPGGKTIKGYEVVEYLGHKIGFVGIATPETYTKSTPTYFQDEEGNWVYTFSEDTSENPDRFYPTIQASIDAAKEAGAEVIVAMGHTGIEGTEKAWSADSIIANTTGVDIYLDGHSHEVKEAGYYPNKDGKDVFYQQTGTKDKVAISDKVSKPGIVKLGEVKIKFTSDGIEVAGRLIDVNALTDSDAPTKALIDDALQQVEESFGEVVGHTNYLLSILDENGNRAIRNRETNMGDFVADAYRILGESDISIVNGGGVRADIAPGDITREMINKTSPFGNNVATVKIPGQIVLDALEHAYRNVPAENGGFFHVSGLEVTINHRIETPVVLDEKGSFDYVDDSKPRRVIDVKVNGDPIDPEKIYTLTGTTYLLQQAGDGYTMFKDLELVKLYGEPDSEFIEKYLVETLGGEVPEEYDGIKGQGRIKIIPISIEKATVSGISNKTYTGKAITQKPTVTLDDETLAEGKDYEVSYKNNKNVGTATVTITGIGEYDGTVSKTFKINANTKIKLDKTSATVYTVNAGKYKNTLQLKATVTGNNNTKVTWTSSNSKVAKVDANGKVTGVSDPGNGITTVTITAKTVDGKTATCKVTVEDPISAFVRRLYKHCLNRNPDESGFKYWTNALRTKRITAADAVKGFFNSNEMKNKKLSNSEIIERCYLSMLDRKSDAGGKKYWEGIFKSKGINTVLKGFVDSNEFTNLCKQYGIVKGTIK